MSFRIMATNTWMELTWMSEIRQLQDFDVTVVQGPCILQEVKRSLARVTSVIVLTLLIYSGIVVLQ